MDFHGYAIGGLAVGEGQKLMFEALSFTVPFLPASKPRYLMGVGTPADIVGAVERGVDMFDCVMPTRSGRHGQAFTWSGKLNMRNAVHIEDMRPLDGTSECPAARDYSRAYIHHLLRAGEYLAPMILSWANTHFYQDLMRAIRQSIREGTFADLAARIREAYPSATVAEDAGPAEPSF
jgi:queuine tRNA-ribosyltransferase